MPTAVEEENLGTHRTDEKGDARFEEERVVDWMSPFASLPDTQRLQEEKRLVRKLDRRLMPMLCAMYLFACVYLLCLRQFDTTNHSQ